MLFLVRHGKTSLNEDGSEKIRSWGTWPLTLEGMDAAEKLGKFFQGTKPYAVYTSPLVRAVQTANEIGEVVRMPIEPRDDLKDWNVGDYTGMDLEKVLDKLLVCIKTNVVPPNGELYNKYLYRIIPAFQEFVKAPKACIAVSHGRGLMVGLMLAKAKGDLDKIDKSILLEKNRIEPGDILAIQPDWSYKIIIVQKNRNVSR